MEIVDAMGRFLPYFSLYIYINNILRDKINLCGFSYFFLNCDAKILAIFYFFFIKFEIMYLEIKYYNIINGVYFRFYTT